ncbi:MAG: cell division protein FtsH, partial [Actinomycetota bacterium]|nr:cell division protein FtsH [Actinomycetota bacterium]
MKKFFRSAAFPILIVLVLAFFASRVINQSDPEEIPTFNDFTERVDTDPESIETVTFEQKENKLKYVLEDGTEYETGYLPEQEDTLINTLAQKNIETNIDPIKGGGILGALTYILPFLLFLGFWIFLMNQMQGGGSRVMSFGKSKAKRMSVDAPKITFRDVAGVDEAVQEL